MKARDKVGNRKSETESEIEINCIFGTGRLCYGGP